MTDRERLAAFLRQQTKQANAWNAQRRASVSQVESILRETEARVLRQLKNAPTDWQLHHLPKVQKAIADALTEMEREMAAAMAEQTQLAVSMGQATISGPLAAAGISLDLAPIISTRQVAATRFFQTDLIQGVAKRGLNKINMQMGLVISGAQTTTQAIDAVSLILQGDRGRAMTVVRTEVARAYGAASQEAKVEYRRFLPGLKKQWHMSGKLHPRRTHQAVHLQIRDVDKPFDVGGEELMYPRDPKGSAKNTVNCGCESYSYMERWDVNTA